METKDHLALGQYLLEKYGNEELYRHKWAFLWGCIEPDCNVLTYFHGVRKCKNLSGHNAENTETIIASYLRDFQSSGLHSSYDYFLLGVMLHYSADTFTLPHNRFSQMSLREHVAYEAQLHRRFQDALSHTSEQRHSGRTDVLFPNYLKLREAYCCSEHTQERDCMFILTVCESLFAGCLHNCQTVMPNITFKECSRQPQPLTVQSAGSK